MSYAFIAALSKYPQQSYVQLLNSIREELRGKYDQKPQLSASHRKLPLLLVGIVLSGSNGYEPFVYMLNKSHSSVMQDLECPPSTYTGSMDRKAISSHLI